MKRLSSLIGLSSLLCSLGAFASIPNRDNQTTSLGPTLKGRYISPLSDVSAFSLLGEAGLRNLRLGGTLGFEINNYQRLKFSGDYLTQKITYAFFSRNNDSWVQQGSISGAYQYDLAGGSLSPQFDLSAYVSYARDNALGTTTGNFVNQSGILQSFVNSKKIAGSLAYGVSPGLGMQLWHGNKTVLELNYDNVDYNQKYETGKDAEGIGGTIRLMQRLTNTIDVGASAAFRQPFNNYTASFYWARIPYYGEWRVGVDGAYTVGKNSMPDSYNVGLNFNYLIDPCPVVLPIHGWRGDYKDEAPLHFVPAHLTIRNYTAEPAVYLPVVLAIPDQSIIKS